MKKVVVAVVLTMLTVGLAAGVLALVYPPMASPRRLLAYGMTMLAVAVGVVVANVWAAALVVISGEAVRG